VKRPPRKGPKFGNGMPIAGDGERLSSLDSIEHAPPIVAQLPNSDFGHRASVSPVRRRGPVRDLCWLPTLSGVTLQPVTGDRPVNSRNTPMWRC